MGCKKYNVNGYHVVFSERDDGTSCLCTFSRNHEPHIDTDTVRSLALLGATVALIAHKDEPETDNEWEIVPFCLPDWVRQGIERAVVCPDCTCGATSGEHFSDCPRFEMF